jgi:hypothetical protein
MRKVFGDFGIRALAELETAKLPPRLDLTISSSDVRLAH